MKLCSKCKQLLPNSNFSPSSGGKYLRPECRECSRKLAKRRKELRSENEYPNSDYICPICLKNETDLKGTGGNASIWVVDHNHITDTFRGYICHNCNRGLGVFEDNIDRLDRAIGYLKK